MALFLGGECLLFLGQDVTGGIFLAQRAKDVGTRLFAAEGAVGG